MANLYADENFDLEVVNQLRMHGHDVLTVQEAKQHGSADIQVLAFAMAAKRAVLTFNRRHFIRLHKQTPAHAGIIVCTEDDAVLLADRVHQAVVSLSVLDNQLIRVNRPP